MAIPIISLKENFAHRLSQLSPRNSSYDSDSLPEDFNELIAQYYTASILNLRDEINANPNISDEEKEVLNKLSLALLDEELSTNTFEIQKIDSMIDQLLANCDNGHPYAYYYHYLKGVMGGVAQHNLDLAMEHFDESIRLNPNFEYPYGFRGIIHLMNGDSAAAMSDLMTVVRMNKGNIAELIKKLINDLSLHS